VFPNNWRRRGLSRGYGVNKRIGSSKKGGLSEREKAAEKILRSRYFLF